MDVTAYDRIGLLYDLTSVIARHDCSIFISKVGTVLDQVKDTFYIKDVHNKKLIDPNALKALREDLTLAVQQHGAGGGTTGGG